MVYRKIISTPLNSAKILVSNEIKPRIKWETKEKIGFVNNEVCFTLRRDGLGKPKKIDEYYIADKVILLKS
jgi:hypothetical protein